MDQKEQNIVIAAPEYEPKRAFRWVFEHPDIPLKLLKSLEIPELQLFRSHYVPKEPFVLELYSERGSEYEMLKYLGTRTDEAKLKYLDAGGQILDMMVLQHVLICDTLKPSKLAYDDTSAASFKIKLDALSVRFVEMGKDKK